MLEVTKGKNGNGYDYFVINTDDGAFTISFEGNLDLYWAYKYHGNILELPETHTIHITKENCTVYYLIDALYQRIINGVPYDDIDEESRDYFFNWTLSDKNPQALVKDGVVCWHSDDYQYENASSVSIAPGDEEYLITFEKSKLTYDDGLMMSYAVRFRNSGSRYHPFNFAFMKMYADFKNYEPEFHQFQFEEMMYKPKTRSLIKEEE